MSIGSLVRFVLSWRLVSAVVNPEPVSPGQHMWICNAFTRKGALEVTVRRLSTKTALVLDYKDCKALAIPLVNTDHLDFRSIAAERVNSSVQIPAPAPLTPGQEEIIESINKTDSPENSVELISGPVGKGSGKEDKSGPPDALGTFYVTQIPEDSTSTLVLVAYRRGDGQADGAKGIATFASHAFPAPADAGLAQVAIIDAFTGQMDASSGKTGKIMIRGTKDNVTESLPFNSMVSVTPGTYDLSLDGNNAAFRAEKKADYLVVRIGSGTDDSDFPEDVIVFAAPSAASRLQLYCSSLLVVAVSMLAKMLE